MNSKARRVNYSTRYGGVYVRVMCPVCNIGGGHRITANQPTCHICSDGTLMRPASNDQCECSWEEAREHAVDVFGMAAFKAENL